MSIDLRQPWRSARFVAFDLETTGTDTSADRIIEIGVVAFEGGEVVDRWNQLVDPEIPVPEIITQVTGITDDDVRGKPTLAEVADRFVAWLSEPLLLAYNHDFDTQMAVSNLARVGRTVELPPCLDPFPFCWKHLKSTKLVRNAQLVTVCEHLGVPLEEAHRAEQDAEAAGRVMLELANHAVLPESLHDLLQVQRVLKREVDETMARFRRNREGGRAVLGSDEVIIELGAAYIYGDEADPVRALFSRIPDVRDLG